MEEEEGTGRGEELENNERRWTGKGEKERRKGAGKGGGLGWLAGVEEKGMERLKEEEDIISYIHLIG